MFVSILPFYTHCFSLASVLHHVLKFLAKRIIRYGLTELVWVCTFFPAMLPSSPERINVFTTENYFRNFSPTNIVFISFFLPLYCCFLRFFLYLCKSNDLRIAHPYNIRQKKTVLHCFHDFEFVWNFITKLFFTSTYFHTKFYWFHIFMLLEYIWSVNAMLMLSLFSLVRYSPIIII